MHALHSQISFSAWCTEGFNPSYTGQILGVEGDRSQLLAPELIHGLIRIYLNLVGAALSISTVRISQTVSGVPSEDRANEKEEQEIGHDFIEVIYK